jgi:ubiquinone/menaquinone biosynthesis C-methylase UbiE
MGVRVSIAILKRMRDKEQQTTYLVERLAPKRGEVILDVGCGTGRELEHILRTARVKKVVGLDASTDQLAHAERRLARYVRRGTAELSIGDAGRDLPFSPRSFDAVISVELVECLPEMKRKRLLREISRVLKPGGRVLIQHTDWDTQLWNASDRKLERRLVHAFCDWKQGWMESSDGWTGRRLLGLFRQSKLFRDVGTNVYVLINDRYEMGSYGYERSQDLRTLAKEVRGIRSIDVRRFLVDLKKHDRNRTYFYSVNRYVILARRRGVIA